MQASQDGGVGAPPGTPLLPSVQRRWLVVLVLSLALLMRIGVVALIHDTYAPRNDAVDYDNIASSLANGEGYGNTSVPGVEGPSAFRAPMYPLALAAVYAVVGGHSWTWGLLENAVIGTALVALIGLVAAQLCGIRAGAVAMAIAAVHPTLMLFGSSLQIEPLLACLELATLAAALRHRARPRGLRYVVLAGVLLGCTALTREVGFWLVPTVALLVWTGTPRWTRRAMITPAIALGVALLVVMPWTVRNAVRLGDFVPVTTTTGVALAGTYNDTAFSNRTYPALWIPPWFDPAMRDVMTAVPRPDEVHVDRALRSAAIDWARDHPTYVAKVAFWNTARLFDLAGPKDAAFIRRFIPYPAWLTTVSVYASYVVYALAVLGAARPAARRLPKSVWLFPALVWGNLAILSGNIRYRASLEPLLVLLAAVAVASWEFGPFAHGWRQEV